MAFYQGKLYALDYGEDLLALDISLDDNTGDPQVSRIGQDIKVNYFVDLFSNKFNDPLIFKRMLYLVELGGSLLLVRRSIFHSHVNTAKDRYTLLLDRVSLMLQYSWLTSRSHGGPR